MLALLMNLGFGASAAASLPARDPYEQLVMDHFPIVYLRLNDAGGVALDSSGHQNHGLYGGSVVHQAEGALVAQDDRYAVSVSTDGGTVLSGVTISGEQVAAGIRDAVFGRRRLAQELWFKIDSAQPADPNLSQTMTALMWGNDSGEPRIAVEWFSAADSPTGVGYWFVSAVLFAVAPFYGGQSLQTINANTGAPLLVIRPGIYYYVVFVYDLDAAVQRLYLNGQLMASSVLQNADVNTFNFPQLVGPAVAKPVYVGRSVIGSGFDGAIDEVAIYGSIPDAALIAARQAQRRPPPPFTFGHRTGLIARNPQHRSGPIVPGTGRRAS